MPARKYTDAQRTSFLYTTYRGMLQRCNNKNSSHYKHYGGKGVKVCEEWENDYVSFYNWALKNNASKELTLDRVDNNLGYSPENCRWVDAKQQANNKSNNRKLTYNGMTKTIAQWSELTRIQESTIRFRLDHYGYTIGQALGYEDKPIKKINRENSRKPVLQFDLDGNLIKEWKSIQEINDELGFNISTLRWCIYGIQKSSHGYIWKYKERKKKDLMPC